MSNTEPESPLSICRLDLVALYPACFDWKRPRPLKIGIDLDLIEAGHAPQAVQRSLRSYCARGCYLKEIRAGAPRIGLQGTPVSVVSTDEAAAALASQTLPRPRH
ncbi:ProQ/FinO family protein [Allochromatium humboldtianum]|uniref:ProQ/FinO family protein n=1 Tax=Allochromatium humboldtianum TaxID=504901 RepID=A0A850RJL0_9GAMM|nr:ProQ/FINO family protein [Allochromatium humboldtianum]NVZ11292.1 ProQ/FinO family protein [Allochromatium humboldtianum]